ncbi:UDP binding domain-containing protein [Streptomyces olivochromogenes]|uniref:UDP binding domain-containing protein n=1 Tax=Streptomyces olivochromogenes TaxID=1963 RepID=UPI0035B426DD
MPCASSSRTTRGPPTRGQHERRGAGRADDVALGLITRALEGSPIEGARVTVWGAAFKPGTNDVRESPALALARALQQAGATVTVHDPRAVIRNPEFDYTHDLSTVRESIAGIPVPAPR